MQAAQRASSSSSLLSEGHDSDYDHLYSYSSHLDLFEHQLFKAATRRSISGSGQRISISGSGGQRTTSRSSQQPFNNHNPRRGGEHHGHGHAHTMNNDFDLLMETQLLMQRTNQLVGLQNRQPNTTTSGSGPTAAAAAVTKKSAGQEWVI